MKTEMIPATKDRRSVELMMVVIMMLMTTTSMIIKNYSPA